MLTWAGTDCQACRSHYCCQEDHRRRAGAATVDLGSGHEDVLVVARREGETRNSGPKLPLSAQGQGLCLGMEAVHMANSPQQRTGAAAVDLVRKRTVR